MINQIFPDTGKEFVEQEHKRMLDAARNARLAASLEAAPPAPVRTRRSLRGLAYSVILVVIASLAFATIAFASAGGGSGGGGPYLVM